VWRLLVVSGRRIAAWLADPRHRRAAWFIALCVAGEVSYCVYRATALNASDLTKGFLTPTRGVLFQGKDIYVDYLFNSYSPFFYCVMAPLALLPDGAATLLWSLLGIAQFTAIVCIVLAMIVRAGAPSERLSVFAGPLLCLVLFADNLHLGQSNLFTLFFVCCALYCLQGGRDVRAGALLSVAIAYKLSPALFLLPLGLRRRFTALGGVVLGLVGCLGVVPAIVFGPGRAVALVRTWCDLIIVPFLSGERLRSATTGWHHTNQSLEAFLQRHFTSYGATRYGGLHRFIDPGFLTDAQASRVALGARLGVLVLLAVVIWRQRRSPRSALPLEASLVLLAMPLLSPVSWINHDIAALVAYVVTANEIVRRPRGDPGRRILMLALGAAAGSTLVSQGASMQSYSLVFLGHFALFCALAWYSFRSAQPTACA
jgi:alpha-1,2-mannosyltransferase